MLQAWGKIRNWKKAQFNVALSTTIVNVVTNQTHSTENVALGDNVTLCLLNNLAVSPVIIRHFYDKFSTAVSSSKVIVRVGSGLQEMLMNVPGNEPLDPNKTIP